MNMEKEAISSSRDYPDAGARKHIRLLDCTLRDGRHINQGKFGEIVIKNVIRSGLTAETMTPTSTAQQRRGRSIDRCIPGRSGM